MKNSLVIFLFFLSCSYGHEIKLEQFLKTYCYNCHDADIQKGDFDIEEMFSEQPFVRHLKKWKQIIQLIEEGDMPPRDKKKQPSQKEKNKFLYTLNQRLNGFDYSSVKNPGSEFSRRLTNSEYENTVNDLFQIKIDILDKLSPDLKSENGFSNNSKTLFFQTSVLEKFYAAAEYVVHHALPIEPTTQAGKRRLNYFMNAEQTKENLASFLNKAYRGRASSKDLETIMLVYNMSRKKFTHEKSIRNTLEFILSSPRFLFKVEEVQKNEEVAAFELASRLSYFLWGSLPDDELLHLAATGQLRNNSVIANQVTRMIANPKSIYLGENLGAEWLKYGQLGVRNRPDPTLNKIMTPSLYEAMKKESALFYTDLHKTNKPIEKLITARYTYLNEELANLYQINGVHGKHMRRVKLNTNQRGGVLTQASILIVTSHPNRSSPILRGNWVLTDLLGTPPPPPPANVDEFNEDDELAIDVRLNQHSNKKQCAGCHKKIDPLGLSLNNFGKLGKWYERRVSKSVLDNGMTLYGLEDLREYLTINKLDTLKRNTVEKSLSFALGRKLYYYDEPAVKKILGTLQKPDSGFRDMIIAIAQSYPFKFNRLSQESKDPCPEDMALSVGPLKGGLKCKLIERF